MYLLFMALINTYPGYDNRAEPVTKYTQTSEPLEEPIYNYPRNSTAYPLIPPESGVFFSVLDTMLQSISKPPQHYTATDNKFVKFNQNTANSLKPVNSTRQLNSTTQSCPSNSTRYGCDSMLESHTNTTINSTNTTINSTNKTEYIYFKSPLVSHPNIIPSTSDPITTNSRSTSTPESQQVIKRPVSIDSLQSYENSINVLIPSMLWILCL